MADDKKMSELISQSIRGKLSKDESQRVQEHVEQNEEAKKFALLTTQIHNSVSGLKVDDSPSTTKLSDAARSRLSESVATAVREKASLSQTGLVAAPSQQSASGISANDENKEPEQMEVVGKFQRIRKLATGGLGEVWLARDEKLGRTVAVKLLNSVAKESSQAWDRFQREAEVTGLLEHPNIVPLYTYGIDRQTGEPFYAMRFVGKRNLANAIEEHHDRVAAGQADSLSLHRLLGIFLDVCQAIAYAHSRGVIHRDLKPENVAIDNFGQVIVLDWGLAKVFEDSELALKLNTNCKLTDSSLTQTLNGEVIGTPAYMSPEQASGDIGSIDERTDIYGLGAILFSILTGEAPHANSIAGADIGNLQQVVDAIANSPTPRPTDFCESVSSDLEEVCMRALARKQHLRFDSAVELAESVEKWIAGQSNKQVEYETLRMEGRELRSDMQSRVNDLERNVRFSSGLPPIQELCNASSDEDIQVWRKRLSVIFEGLMQANPGCQSIVCGRFEDDSYTEVVRIERQGTNVSGLRSVPRSRLKTSQKNEFLKRLSENLPGDVLTSLVCDPHCEFGKDCTDVGLLSGIPIFDERTEEIFGFVMINCDIYQALDQQLERSLSTKEIVVACDIFHVMAHKRGGKIVHETRTQPVKEAVPDFLPAIAHLQNNLDYTDGSKSEIYGARLWFVPDEHGIMYLLKR